MNNHIEENDYAAYMDDELSEEKFEVVQLHLTSCLSCSQEMERLQEVKIRLSNLKHRTAPAELLARLRPPEVRVRFWERYRGFFAPSFVWKPLVGFAAASFALVIWLTPARESDDFVDLDTLVVAHTKYKAESFATQADLANSNYTYRLASFYRDDNQQQ